MKKLYFYLFNLGSLIFLEMLFGLVVFDSYLKTTIFSVFLFILFLSVFNTIILSLFKRKINYILGCVIYSILGIYFSLQIVFKQVFDTFFQVALFSLSDQLLSFGKETIISILSNLHYIALAFVPLFLFILFRKKLDLTRLKLKS